MVFRYGEGIRVDAERFRPTFALLFAFKCRLGHVRLSPEFRSYYKKGHSNARS